MPSANTIGIESSTSTAKTMATVASSMSASVSGLAARRRTDHDGEPIDGDQDAANHAGGVEPGQIDFEPGRRQRAVEQAKLDAVPGRQQTETRDQRVIETMDPELHGFRQTMHEHAERKMGARLDAYRRPNQRQPRQRHLADFLDPGKRYRIDIEPVGDGADEIAQDHADQEVDDGKNDQRRDRDLRDG